MSITFALSNIDAAIQKLVAARKQLLTAPFVKPAKTAKAAPVARPGKGRNLSDEGRARIAAAQKKRWAAVRKAQKKAGRLGA